MSATDGPGRKQSEIYKPTGNSPPFLRLPPDKRNRIRKPFLYLTGAALLILLATGLLGDSSLRTYLELRQEQRKLDAEVQLLKLRETQLQADLDALANDPQALERIARERYRMLQDGEQIIEVVNDLDGK